MTPPTTGYRLPLYPAALPTAYRLRLLGLLFALLGLAVIGRVILIQSRPETAQLRAQGIVNAPGYHTYFPPRGQIYDRYGSLLAGNRQVYEVALDLNYVRDPQTIAFALKNVLANHVGYNHPGYYAEVFEKANRNPAQGSYQVVADFVTQAELDELIEWARRYEALPEPARGQSRPTLAGLVFRPRPQRLYPEGDLAANLLGFVNWEGRGVFGLEEHYNDLLAGKAVPYLVDRNPLHADDLPPSLEVGGSAGLVLTIDRDLQAATETILDQALAQNGAAGGLIVVMEVKTGEILALANAPRLDPNQYYYYSDLLNTSRPYNMAVSASYEPGSVFKVLTMAIALDSGLVTPATTYIDNGWIEIGGITIYNWNFGAWGQQDMTGCMMNSLNVCMVWLVKQLGPTTFYDYLNRFGIGHRTGIDLAGEVIGRLKLPGDSDWYEADLGTNAFGQGVAVTPAQMLAAVSALANDGQMVTPHLVRAIVQNGRQYNIPTSISGAPIRPETARTLTEMLAVSIETESNAAQVPGYRLAGKTGTAEIATATGYTSGQTNASFVGWGPADDPQYLIYIWFEKPASSPWGSVVAAPVFSQVFAQTALLTGLPPDSVRLQLKQTNLGGGETARSAGGE